MRELDNNYTEKRDYVKLSDVMILKKWFQYDYLVRKAEIERNTYLGLPLKETRYELETEAYEKDQELRKLEGREPLPDIKKRVII